MTKRIVLVAGVSLVLGMGLGFVFAGVDDQTALDAAVAEAIAAVTPAPTPDPTPIPPPLIIEVAPQSCLDAIDTMTDVIGVLTAFLQDILSAHIDHPDESLAEFGARVDAVILTLDTPGAAEGAALAALLRSCRDAG